METKEETAARPRPRTAVVAAPSASSFLPVAGMPLLRRIVLGAARAGFDRVVVLSGSEDERARRVLGGDRRTRSVPVVDAARAADPDEPVALLPSDWLLDAAALARVRERAAVNGHALHFSAGGELSLPVVVCGAAELREWAAPGAAREESGHCRSFALEGEPCMHVGSTAAVRGAERRLVAQLRAATFATDGPLARFDRALSTRLSLWLVKTPLRPNHITTIGTLLGILAAWWFARGTYGMGVAASLLFWAATILDGCDGEVARLKFQESRFGGLYDVVTDNLVHVAIFAGLGIGAYRKAPSDQHVLLIGLLIAGFLTSLPATYFCLLRNPPSRAERPRTRQGRARQRLLRLFEALMNRDFSYLLIVLALAGRLDWFLWGAAFGTYVYSAALLCVYLWRSAE